jgi:hypothetical protein
MPNPLGRTTTRLNHSTPISHRPRKTSPHSNPACPRPCIVVVELFSISTQGVPTLTDQEPAHSVTITVLRVYIKSYPCVSLRPTASSGLSNICPSSKLSVSSPRSSPLSAVRRIWIGDGSKSTIKEKTTPETKTSRSCSFRAVQQSSNNTTSVFQS